MRIEELIIENQQLDELTAAQVGQGIGRAATATGTALGATAGGAVQAGKNFWQGVKQGWQSGKSSVGGGAAPAAGTAPTTGAAPKVTVTQINQAIPTLRTRDLQSVKKNVDAIVAKKSRGAAPATGAAPTTAPATGTPNLQVQQGGKKKTAALLQPKQQAVPESKFYSKFLNMDI